MKFTFLLGAGASANSLPVVNDIPNRISEIINLLDYPELDIDTLQEDYTSQNPKKIKKTIHDNLKWLYENSIVHSSIDTFAKKLWLRQEENEFKKLKCTLSFCFTLIQMQNSADKRYDTFFASILRKNVVDLPNEISIISWNYDNQIEMAYSEFINNKSYKEIQKLININTPKLFNENNDGKFTLFKLNGSIGFFNSGIKIKGLTTKHGELNHFNPIVDYKLNKLNFFELCNLYLQVLGSDKTESDLCFAWENEENNLMMNSVFSTISKTDILVCIGYSFPFYNRRIDNEIFQCASRLKKIYVQDRFPYEIINTLKKSMNLNPKIEYIDISNCESFNIPREF